MDTDVETETDIDTNTDMETLLKQLTRIQEH
jgi:hypothetical protein